MSATDERLAIWRYATPAERQRVIDGEWAIRETSLAQTQAIIVHGHPCCPWGAALDGYDNPANVVDLPGWPGAMPVARHIGSEDLITAVGDFMGDWDRGVITRAALIAYLQQLNAQEAATDGQATVLVALGSWLAFLVACAVVAGCVYGAQWADMLWLAPWGGR
jgi:hypothetical protein